jgi:hypothetical protein
MEFGESPGNAGAFFFSKNQFLPQFEFHASAYYFYGLQNWT